MPIVTAACILRRREVIVMLLQFHEKTDTDVAVGKTGRGMEVCA